MSQAIERVAVVGTGNIGLRHAANALRLRPDTRVTVVGRQRPPQLGAEFDHAATLDLALRSRPSAVILANPCVFHIENARRCLEAGAHVFVEKPLAPASDGLAGMFDQAARLNKLVMVGYHLRHHACLLQIKRMLDAGDIGRLLTLMVEVGQDLSEWRPAKDYRQTVSAQKALGGGVLLELSHELDLCTWLGGRAVAASASISHASALELDVEDNAQIMLRLAPGATALIHLDFIQRPGGRRYRFIGTDGALDWHASHPVVQFTSHADGQTTAHGCDEAVDGNHPYLAELEAFLSCIESGRFAVPPSALHALHVVRIVEACRQSSQTGLQINV